MSPAKRTPPRPSPTPQPLLVLSPDHCFLTSLPRPNFSPNNPATPLESALPQTPTSPPVTPIESMPFFTITHIFARSAPATPVSTTLTKYPSCNPRRMNTSAKHPVAPNAGSPLTIYYAMTYTKFHAPWSYALRTRSYLRVTSPRSRAPQTRSPQVPTPQTPAPQVPVPQVPAPRIRPVAPEKAAAIPGQSAPSAILALEAKRVR